MLSKTNPGCLINRNNSIACLRAKAQEHQARLLNSGLLLQVRSLAGLQNPLHHNHGGGGMAGGGPGGEPAGVIGNGGIPSPHPCDSNGNNLLMGSAAHHSSSQENLNLAAIDRQRSEANSSNGSAISIKCRSNSPNVATF